MSGYENLRYIVLVPVVIMHISNIFATIKNHHLHNIRYYILINLSISDLLMLGTLPLNFILSQDYVSPLKFTFYHSSILSTVLMSVDRYIAIKHFLRYREIVTIKKLVISIIASWSFSIVINLLFLIIPKIFGNNLLYFQICRDITTYGIILGSCIVLVYLSIKMLLVRWKHVKALMKVKSRFGVEKERLDMLQKLKQNMEDIFRLNLFTVIIVVLSITSDNIHTYSLINAAKTMSTIFRAAYFMSNPFLYCLTMSGLRTYYYNSFRRILCNSSRIQH